MSQKEKVSIGISEKSKWDDKWTEIFDHYQQDLRHAYYIRAILNANEKKVLELAAGSFRDTGALDAMGIDASGVDYSSQAVALAKKQFPSIVEKISEQDGFKMGFDDNTFDLSFHNGFWVCFSEDKDIMKLAEEQARITKHRIVATVHNAHNKEFVEYFNRLRENDPLYRVRFFEVDEITELMKSVAKNVKIIPVGKGKKYYEDDLINIGLGDPQYLRKSFDYHGMNLLNTSERLLCIGEL